MIFFGTCSGLVLSLICFLMRSRSIVERVPSLQPHEKKDLAHLLNASPISLAYRNTLDDLRQLLDLPVNLGRSNPHTARIERRVAAAVDDHSLMLGELAPVAVPPDVRIFLEIGSAILSAPSGSFQNATGMLVNGRVQTSSPASSTPARRRR